MIKSADPNVIQPKPGAFRPQFCLCWTLPASIKANRKLMLSASTPEQERVLCLLTVFLVTPPDEERVWDIAFQHIENFLTSYNIFDKVTK